MSYKKISLLLIVIGHVLYTCAQNDKTDLQKANMRGSVKTVKTTTFVYSDDTKALKENSAILVENYNKQGNLTVTYNYSPNGHIDTESISTYNNTGQVVDYYHELSTRKMRTHSAYDEKGNLTELTIYENMTQKSMVVKFDSHGNVIENTDYKPDGAVDPNGTTSDSSFYDNEGLETSQKIFDADGKLQMVWFFKYDNNRNMIECDYYNADGSYRDKDGYKYDRNRNMTEIYRTNKNGVKDYKARMRYDKYNNLVQTYTYTSRNGKKPIKDVTQYKYDATGNWIWQQTTTDGKTIMVDMREIAYY